jgi:hypothetical protein
LEITQPRNRVQHSIPYSDCRTARRSPIAVSVFGGFRTPAAEARGTVRQLPASETLHNSGLSHRSKQHRYSITSSAMASTPGESSMPSARAVCRLITSSCLVGPRGNHEPATVVRNLQSQAVGLHSSRAGTNQLGRFEMLTQTKIALAAALILGTASAALAKGRGSPGGSVVRCSLEGVNPGYHPGIFGNAATAKAYGFVQSPDHTWHVDRQVCESREHRPMSAAVAEGAGTLGSI